jgi:hypothetical protein
MLSLAQLKLLLGSLLWFPYARLSELLTDHVKVEVGSMLKPLRFGV